MPKIEERYLMKYLQEHNRQDLVELLKKSDQKRVATVKIARMLVPDITMHDMIVEHLSENGVTVIQ